MRAHAAARCLCAGLLACLLICVQSLNRRHGGSGAPLRWNRGRVPGLFLRGSASPFPCPATVPPRDSAPTRHPDRSPVKPPTSSRPSSKREMMNRSSKSRAFYTRPPIGTKYDIQLSQKQILAQRTVLFPHCARAAASLFCALRRDSLVEKSPRNRRETAPLCLCLPSASCLRSLANCT